MSKSVSRALPDLDDDEFTARLRPLENSVIPGFKTADIRTNGQPNESVSEGSKVRRSRSSVAEHIEAIEERRGPKRRFEYLIPVRVGEALAEDAAKRGQSAATRLLEILRDSGYPVISEDFIDLRKERGRP
jgi:hypothetical protein